MTITIGAIGNVNTQLPWHTDKAMELVYDGLGAIDSFWASSHVTAGSINRVSVPVPSIDSQTNNKIEVTKSSAIPPTFLKTQSEAVLTAKIEQEWGDSPEYAVLTLPKLPTPKLPLAPDAPAPIKAVQLPIAPELPLVDEPKEYPLTLPEPANINVSEFTGIKPVYDGPNTPSSNFTWSELPYTTHELEHIEAVIHEMLGGTTGIPDDQWDAIWGRDSDKQTKIDVKYSKSIIQANAQRGFTLLSGPLIALQLEQAQAVYDADMARTRDISITQVQHEVENLKNAVAQGLQLETLKSTIYEQITNRLFEASKFASQFALEVYLGAAQFYNVQMQAYKIEADVFRTQLESEKLKLDIYLGELQAMTEVGKLNQQEIDKYIARYNALKTKVDLYLAQMQGSKIEADINMQYIQEYEIRVRAHTSQVSAAMSEYEGYKAASQGASAQAGITNANTNLYKARFDTVKEGTNINIAMDELKIKEEDAKLKRLAHDLTKYGKDTNKYDSIIKEHLNTLETMIRSEGEFNQRLNLIDRNKIQVYQNELAQARLDLATSTGNRDSRLKALIEQTNNTIELARHRAEINAAAGGHLLSALNISNTASDSATTTLAQ